LAILYSLPPIPLPGGNDSLQDVIRTGEAAIKKAAREASATQKVCVGAVLLTANLLIYEKVGLDYTIYKKSELEISIKGQISDVGVTYGSFELKYKF
jgi:hypothetical protein